MASAVQITNAAAFNAGLDKWMADMDRLADGVLRGLAVEAFTLIVRESAQWSGNLAASWSLSVGNPDAVSETPFKNTEPPKTSAPPFESLYLKGSNPAFNYAMANMRSSGVLSQMYLGEDVWIATGVPYAQAVREDRHPELQKAFLRPGNTPSDMLEYAATKFRAYGALSYAAARKLGGRFV
jgi:hypothetical protein